MKIKKIPAKTFYLLRTRKDRHAAWLKQHPGNSPVSDAFDFVWCDGELIACNRRDFKTQLKFRQSYNTVIFPSTRDWEKKPDATIKVVVRPKPEDRTLKMAIEVPKRTSEKPPMRFNKSANEIPTGYKLEELTTHERILYKMLDDIDTADDLAKGNEKLYRNLVRKAIKKIRESQMFHSDGYTVKKIVPTKGYVKKWNRKLDEMMTDDR